MSELSNRTPAQPKGTGTDEAPAVTNRSLNKSCMVVVKHSGNTDSFGGHTINGSDVHTALILSRNPRREVFLGLSVEFPIPYVNQLDFSCYTAGRSSNDTIVVAGEHRLLVKFPCDGFTATVSSVPSGLDIDLPAELREKYSLLKIEIGNVDDIRIEGLGMPYSNSRHRCADWLRGMPVAGNLTLLDILKSPEQSFIVNFKPEPMQKELNPDVWPAPFEYPWGDTHFWDVDRFRQQAEENPGGRYLTAWTFATDNDHAAVLTQSLAQDIVWVDDAAKRLSDVRLRAYIAEPPNPRAWACLVVPCDEWFGRTFEYAWLRLIACKLSVVLFDEEGNERSTRRAEICEHPEFLSDMRDHPVAGHELVLRVCPWASGGVYETGLPEFKIKTFSERRRALQALDQSGDNWNLVSLQFDVETKDYGRKCDAVNEMLPGSRPSNPTVFGLTVPDAIYAPLIGRPEDLQHVAERQRLARAVISGTGFDGIS
ncbi:unnamed protein product [Clonostachys chloroleuca]|uniref:Uncharacterized protein n=1 Tax=Clonostachys chloroleuca TaxID=1926264 RepID=A0AA35PW88_9HYPO|nr:unnamed protein product [Clonostachys chloroleuca]